ncbi:MAG: MFS transporter [Erysipelotrichaceae bacterium]
MSKLKKKIYHNLPALSSKNYRLYFLGMCVSSIGSWMQSIAQSWLVYELTADPFLLGLVSSMQFLPLLLFGLLGGTIADYLPKRKILFFTQGAFAFLTGTLFILTITGVLEYWMILIFAFLFGCCNAVDVPTRQSFMLEIVSNDNLQNAIVLNSTVYNMAKLIGPMLAGIIIAQFSIELCFLLNSLSYIAIIFALAKMDYQSALSNNSKVFKFKKIFKDMAGGIKYITSSIELYIPILLVFFVNVILMNFSVMLPIYTNAIGQEATGYSMLNTSMGIGSIIVALTIALRIKNKPSKILMFGSTFVTALCYILLGLNRNIYLACLIMIFAGASLFLTTTSINTNIQLNSAKEMRGRVMGVYGLMFGGSTPIGALYTGAITSYYNIFIFMIISAILMILVSTILIFIYRVIINKKIKTIVL